MWSGRSAFGGIAAVIALVASVGVASAATDTTLSLTSGTFGPQSQSAPCVIGGTHCSNPAGFGYNDYDQAGNLTSHDLYSTTPTATVAEGVQGNPYTVGQIETIVGTSFGVAIDVNTAKGGETLQSFQVIDLTTGNTWTYTGPTLIGDAANNGNGYGDWLLSTIDFSGLNPADNILFHAVWNNQSDGAESFFLISMAAVPLPGALPLFGTGLGMMGLLAMRRRRKVV